MINSPNLLSVLWESALSCAHIKVFGILSSGKTCYCAQWRWQFAAGQICSGSLVTFRPQTGVITGGAALSSLTPSASRKQVLTRIGVAHCRVRRCLCCMGPSMRILCHRFLVIWPPCQGKMFCFQMSQWLPRISCCHEWLFSIKLIQPNLKSSWPVTKTEPSRWWGGISWKVLMHNQPL